MRGSGGRSPYDIRSVSRRQFIGEFLLLSGIFQYSQYLSGFAGLTIILSAVYMLRTYQHTMLGEEKNFAFADLFTSEKIVDAIVRSIEKI